MQSNEFLQYLKRKYPQTSSFISGIALFIIDAFVLLLCIGIGFFIVNLFAKSDINFKSFVNYCIYIPFILLVYGCNGLYPGIMIPPAEIVKKFFASTGLSFLAIILTIILPEINELTLTKFIINDSNTFKVTIALFIAFIFSIFLLPAFREISKYALKNFTWWGVPCVVYTDGNYANFFLDNLIQNRNLGYHPCTIVDSSLKTESEYKGIPVLPPDSDKIKIIHAYNVKNAIICGYKGSLTPIMTVYRYTISIPKIQTDFTCSQHLKEIGGIIGFASVHNLTFKANRILKRLSDLLLLIVFSPLLIPVFLILGILVKATSKGPVFYGHKRVGKNGKEFKCWKFRSMNVNSQEMLQKILSEDPKRRSEWEKERKFSDDPRVTKFGKFLRKTSLDELPQLINILKGEMSFIGPRPVTKEETEKYGDKKDYVLSVLPGLSGMWQISGRSETSYEERITFDTYYIQNWSVWLDIWILIKTIWVVFKGKGAY